jgi:hypothetical protein
MCACSEPGTRLVGMVQLTRRFLLPGGLLVDLVAMLRDSLVLASLALEPLGRPHNRL